MSTTQAQFMEAVEQVKSAPSTKKPSKESQLEMYALFKQANEGDVKGKKPSMLNPVAKAKYQAWSKLQGMTQEDAMQAYISKVEDILR